MKHTLYKRASNGKIQEWSIEVHGNAFRTWEGYIGGAMTWTAWTTCAGKNIGRANGTSPEQQAEKEVVARIKKQTDNGWTTDVSDVDVAKQSIALKPMLAKDAKDGWLDRLLESGVAIALQPKLDGIRAVAADQLYSRNLKVFNSSPHILDMITQVREAVGLDHLILDGELYNHEYHDDFNKLGSLIKKTKPKPEDLQESLEKVQYHIFDIVDNKKTFQERYALAKKFVAMFWHIAGVEHWDRNTIQLVETKFLNKATREDVDKYYETVMEQGYEGHMARKVFSHYQADKRSADLVKRKEMQDAEFTIADIEEGKGNRKGVAARVYFLNNGVKFKAGIKGDMEYCKELLKNKSKYIGKAATVQFQNYTPGDKPVPRFPKMTAIRDYE